MGLFVALVIISVVLARVLLVVMGVFLIIMNKSSIMEFVWLLVLQASQFSREKNV
jgi:hypothetical protein